MIHNRLKFTSLLLALVAEGLEAWIGVWVNRVSIPIRKANMSSHTDEFWKNETELSVDDCIYIYIYITYNSTVRKQDVVKKISR